MISGYQCRQLRLAVARNGEKVEGGRWKVEVYSGQESMARDQKKEQNPLFFINIY